MHYLLPCVARDERCQEADWIVERETLQNCPAEKFDVDFAHKLDSSRRINGHCLGFGCEPRRTLIFNDRHERPPDPSHMVPSVDSFERSNIGGYGHLLSDHHTQLRTYLEYVRVFLYLFGRDSQSPRTFLVAGSFRLKSESWIRIQMGQSHVELIV